MQTPAFPIRLPTPPGLPKPQAAGTTPQPAHEAPVTRPEAAATAIAAAGTTQSSTKGDGATATPAMRIKVPPRKKLVKGNKVDAEATLIEAKLSQAESPPPSNPLQANEGDLSSTSADSTPTPAARRGAAPVAAPHILGTPTPGVSVPSSVRALKFSRQDSAPPSLGQAKLSSGDSTDPPTPEECTWPKDGFSVHGNSSTESVTILECMGEAAASERTNFDMLVTDGLDRRGNPIVGRPQKRARTLTPPESITEELLRRRAVTQATTDVSVKYNRDGRGHKKPQPQGPPTITAYLPHPPTPFQVVPKPGKPNDFASKVPPRSQDCGLYPLYEEKPRSREEQERNEANYYALAVAAAIERGELSAPPPDLSTAPPREHSPFPVPNDYYDPPAAGTSAIQPGQPQPPQDFPMRDPSPPPPPPSVPFAAPDHQAHDQPETNTRGQVMMEVNAPQVHVEPAGHSVPARQVGNAWENQSLPQGPPAPPLVQHAPPMPDPAAYTPLPLKGPNVPVPFPLPVSLTGPNTHAWGPEAPPHIMPEGEILHAVNAHPQYHMPLSQKAVTGPEPPAEIAPHPAHPETYLHVHGLDDMDVFASENGSEAGEVSDDELIPGAPIIAVSTVHPSQAAQAPGYAPLLWNDQQIELTPDTASKLKFTSMPPNGWPTTYVSDPEDGVVGSDQDRLTAWWAHPANMCMLVKVFGRGLPKEDEVYDLTMKICNLLKVFLEDDDIDLIIVPPEAGDTSSDTRQSGPLPNSWFIANLLPAHQSKCIEARVLSCREVSILIYPRVSRFPRLLMAVGNFRRNVPAEIVATIKNTFETPEIQTNIARFIRGNPRRNREPMNVAIQRIIDSVSIQVYKLAEGKYVANVFSDSPAANAPEFRIWQHSFDHVRFKSATDPTAKVRPLRPCRGCHASCHPSHLCPFPAILGWNGPDTRKNSSTTFSGPAPLGSNAAPSGAAPQNGPGNSRWPRNGPPTQQYRNDNRDQPWAQSPRKQRFDYRWNGAQAGPSGSRNQGPRY